MPKPIEINSAFNNFLSFWGWKRLPENLPQSLTTPAAHQRCMRISNPLEWINQELKNVTEWAPFVPNEASLLRLIFELLNEIGDDWQSRKIHLSMDNQNPVSV